LIRDVLRYPDRRLKTPAVAIPTVGPAALRLAMDLQDTARHYPRTVGLAAPQIGAPWRMIYVDCTDHPRVPDAVGPTWMINPVVESADGFEVGREGCLSLPEITANVARPTAITVRYRDRDGGVCHIEAANFAARVILHEIDHLDGVLILDRVASLALDVFPRKRR
jgi:peptide deformylase